MKPRNETFLADPKNPRFVKKEYLKKRSMNVLNEFNIAYSIHNNGLHIKIPYQNEMIEFWPTTEKWYDKSIKKHGQSIETLLEYMNKLEIKE